jgi:hypothetical protein
VAQVVGAMTALKQIAGPRSFLLVGDSKLISYANAAAMAAGQVGFVAPLAASRVPAGLFAALPPGAGTEVGYTAARDAGKPAAARGTYRVLEDGGMDIPGPRKSDPAVHLRRILVYSSANATGQAKARAAKLAKAAGELDKLVRTAGTRFHPTEDAVASRDLPGSAYLLPGRAAGPPSAGPARRDDDRPARLRPHPRPPHRQDHLPCTGRPAPDPRPRRQPRYHPQTRRCPSPAPRPPQDRYQPTPLAHPVKPMCEEQV